MARTSRRVAYFGEKLRLCNITKMDRIRLGMGETEFTVSVDDFLAWGTEYAIAGISLSLTKDAPGFGQILTRDPGRSGRLVRTLPLGEPPTGA